MEEKFGAKERWKKAGLDGVDDTGRTLDVTTPKWEELEDCFAPGRFSRLIERPMVNLNTAECG